MGKLKVCSLFSGIGGFETGIFKSLGKGQVDVVFASEIDKHASASYAQIYNHVPKGDITKIDVKEIPEHDVLVGGFPCQAFSVAGKRQGFDDTRGTLFFEIVRVTKEKKPKIMVLENVKGLLSHDKGKTVEVIMETLSEIGYKVDFSVLNSKHFGVPQSRERIYIICLLDVKEEKWLFQKGNGVLLKTKKRLSKNGKIKQFNFDFSHEADINCSLIDIIEENVDLKYFLNKEKMNKLVLFEKKESKKGKNKLDQIGYIDKNAQGNRVYTLEGLSPTVSSQTGGVGGSGGGVFAEKIEEEIRGIVSKSRPNEEISVKFKENGDIRPHRNDKRKSGISELNINHEKNVSFTVTASHAPKIYGESTDWRIRKLSPLECLRLQGFPDSYYYSLKEFGISDRQLYKMAGNAVTTNVVSFIFKRLKKYI